MFYKGKCKLESEHGRFECKGKKPSVESQSKGNKFGFVLLHAWREFLGFLEDFIERKLHTWHKNNTLLLRYTMLQKLEEKVLAHSIWEGEHQGFDGK